LIIGKMLKNLETPPKTEKAFIRQCLKK